MGICAIGFDTYSLTNPKLQALQSCKQLGNIIAHCAVTLTAAPRFVIPVFDTVHQSGLGDPA